MPLPLDLAGQSDSASAYGLASFAALPEAPSPGTCHSPLPIMSGAGPLHSESGDVLHGLPASDLQRPLSEPVRAALFQ